MRDQDDWTIVWRREHVGKPIDSEPCTKKIPSDSDTEEPGWDVLRPDTVFGYYTE